MGQGPADPRSTFGPAAEKYAKSAVHASPAALERLVEVSAIRGGTLMDVATGTGHTAFAFAPFVERIVALDMTEHMLRVCRREAQQSGLTNIYPVLGEAQSLPVRSGSLDALTCRLAPHHFPGVGRFLAEVRRSLRMGGTFALVDTTGPEDSQASGALDLIERLRDPSHIHDLKPSEWRRELAEAGFELLREESAEKELGLEEWLARTSTPAADAETVRGLINTSSGALRDYLKPRIEGGLATFSLSEHLFVCRR
jgi:ubiquinone/menaquinone biosynthesis C-methylase UbiE